MMIFKKGFIANKIKIHYSQYQNPTSTTGITVYAEYTFYYNNIELLKYKITSENDYNILQELQNNGINKMNRDKAIVLNESTLLYEKEVNIDKITIEDLGEINKVTFYDNGIVILVSYLGRFQAISIMHRFLENYKNKGD